MGAYSQKISVLSSRAKTRAKSVQVPKPTEVTWLAAWFLPNFLCAVFAVTIFQVLFLSAGSPRLFHDSDTGWHVRDGEAIVSTASVPRTDNFSYTRPGEPWFAWEWLSDAAFGVLHRIAGLPALAFTAAFLIALTASGAAQLALSLGGNLFFTAAATILLLGVTSMHWLARPHLFSWILALVFLSVAEHERRRPSWALHALAGLAVIWANVHGSFLLGPAILFTYALGEWISRFMMQRNSPPQLRRGEPRRWEPPKAATNESGGWGGVGQEIESFDQHHASPSRHPSSAEEGSLLSRGRRFALASLLCLLGTFINPYGWRLHQHILSYLRNGYLMDHIQEFRSFDFHSSGALYVEFFLGTAILGTLLLVRYGAYGPALLSLGMLHASFYSARHLPTAAVLLLPLSVAALTREAERFPRLQRFIAYSERLRAIDRRIYAVIPVGLVFVIIILGLNADATAGRVTFDNSTFPVAAADFLEKNNIDRDAHVFAKDQWGGYLIYRFAGRMKVFVDGRSDFYGQSLLETYAQVIEVKPGWDSVLKQYGVRFVLVSPDHALASALQLSPQWKHVYSDPVAAVYERIG